MRCPICRQETSWKDNPYRPFCSSRCSVTDLANWSTEKYTLSAPLSAEDLKEENERTTSAAEPEIL